GAGLGRRHRRRPSSGRPPRNARNRRHRPVRLPARSGPPRRASLCLAPSPPPQGRSSMKIAVAALGLTFLAAPALAAPTHHVLGRADGSVVHYSLDWP